MQKIESPDIYVSDSMKNCIETLMKKIDQVANQRVNSHILICKETDKTISIKLNIHWERKAFFFESKGENFRNLIDRLKSKALRAFSDYKGKKFISSSSKKLH